MRVLIADKLATVAKDRLTEGDVQIQSDPGLKDQALQEALTRWDPDVLVVRSTRVTEDHIAASRSLSLIVRAGAGVNTIDLAAASDRGVFVANCPGRNSIAVAELAMGLVLAIDRHIPAGTADLRAGTWNKGRYSAASGLAGRTLGIVGMGGIGRALATRAQAFDMDVVAWSRSLSPEDAAALGVTHASSSLDVARQSDVLSVHLAMNPQTSGLIDAEHLAALGPDGVLINTARAGVVDSDALLAALDGGLRAGLDVFPDEPSGKQGSLDHPLARHPRVVGTHHIGASTQQAQDAVAHAVADIVLGFKTTGLAHNCVNLSTRSAATGLLVVRHEDRVGVLAEVLDGLRKRNVNVQEMENRIFAGGKAAVARIQVSGPVDPQLLASLLQLPHILHCALVPLEPTP